MYVVYGIMAFDLMLAQQYFMDWYALGGALYAYVYIFNFIAETIRHQMNGWNKI